MEVKNPLFLDDPTPATPANVSQQQTQSTNQGQKSGTINNTNEKKVNGHEKKTKK